MAGPYPFPLPDSTREEFEKTNSPALIRDALDGATVCGGEPFHSDFLFWWHNRAHAFFLALERSWIQDGGSDQANIMWACISALKQEFDRLGRLLPFFEATWPHDPVIKAHFQGNGDKAAAEKEGN